MKTCRVCATVFVNREQVAQKVWDNVDIMNPSRTRAWLTRQFNKYRAAHCSRDELVVGTWECLYDQPQEEGGEYHHRFEGRISSINGRTYRRGVLEE